MGRVMSRKQPQPLGENVTHTGAHGKTRKAAESQWETRKEFQAPGWNLT